MNAVADMLSKTVKQVEFTQEQKENLEKFKEQKISKLTEQFSFDDCKKAVDSLYKFIGEKSPKLILVSGPIGAVNAIQKETDCNRDEAIKAMRKDFVSLFKFKPDAYVAEYIKIHNLAKLPDTADTFINICRYCPIIWAYNGVCFVSQNPVEVHFQGVDLHNEHGPALLFSDGFPLWVIKGILVDEQIVMRPETQTMEQIENETNPDVKKIRLERFKSK